MTWQIFFAGIGFGFLAVVAIGLAYIAIVFAASWLTLNLKRHRGAPDYPAFWRTEINRYQVKHAGVAGPWKTVWGSHPILKVFGLSDAVRGRWFIGWLRFDARVHTDEKDLIPQCRNAGRYLAEINDGTLCYLNHANEWQACPHFIKPSGDLPALPDDDADFTPELARNIIAVYQRLLGEAKCEACDGAGVNHHDQLWPGVIRCRYCKGTGKEPVVDPKVLPQQSLVVPMPLTPPKEGDDVYLIRKGVYFYRPNYQGYTTVKAEAGRYTKRDAEHEAAIEPKNMSAVKADDVPNPPHMVCLTCGAQDVGSGP